MLTKKIYAELSKYREHDTYDGYVKSLKECFNVACNAIFTEIDFQAGHLIINYQPEESDERWTYVTSQALQNSRACFLFKEYQRYINSKKERNKHYTPYFIHDYFKDEPSLVCMSLEKTESNQIHVTYYKEDSIDPQKSTIDRNLGKGKSGKNEYKEFLSVMFDVNIGDNEFENMLKKPLSNGDAVKGSIEDFTNVPSAFISFNLSIPYFSYMGSIMFEITESDFDVENFIFETKAKLVQIREVLMVVKRIEYEYLTKKNLQKIKSESIKSAKAAIMSRNMSHNLGSHVMFYIKQKLQSVSKIVDSDVLYNILPGNISDLQEIQKRIAEKKEIELPFLVGLGRFINYLQERQDYIATVATDYIPANSTISFKDFLYDELKPDLRHKRHHPEGSSSDAGWQPSNLLLDYIAYSEGYDSSNKIQISFEEFDGMNSAGNHDFDKLRKFNIAVPGGVIGRQAFFSIVENIIRNAAKHSMRRDDNKISLTFSLLDSIEKLRALSQNASLIRTKRNEYVDIESGELLIEKYKNAMDDYHILEIRLNMLNRYNDIDALVQKLGESYVDSTGIMKDSSKGLKEMRISAAWLRGYSIDTDINSTLPPALSVRTIPRCDDKVEFSYIICLPKPKKVAFVLDDIEGFESMNDLLITYGCRLFKFEENLQIHGYDLVCLGLSEEAHIREITSRVSSGVIANPDVVVEFIKNIKTAGTDEIKTKIDGIYDSWFDLWYEKSYTSPKPKLTILDNKAHDKNQAYIKDFVKDINLTTTGNISDEVCDNSIVYSTHYSGISNLSDDLARKYSKALAVESITGNNSTDRLIRQDEWNREWYNKHLYAGIVKVGIFDERIYSTFVISKSSINKGNFFIDCESLKTGELKVMDFAKKYNVGVNTAINMKNYTSEELQNFLASKKSYDVRVAQMNRERRVWAMDLIVESDKLIIKGFNTDTNDCVGISESLSNKDAEVDIAVIKKAGEGFEIQSLLDNNPYYQAFDIISIHQGILDKIYTALGIKDNEDDKYKITHDLHEFFVKSQTPKNEKEYLPYFVIHSGRSKPNRNDMPQKQPFIQFAAIDHAVKDCKYTLVELLTSAYYESDSIN